MLERMALLATSAVTCALLGCSGGSPPPGGAPEGGEHADARSHKEAASSDRGPMAEASGGDAGDAPHGEAGVDASGAGSGPCASCTAGMCPTALEACALSSDCTNGIVAFNSCFTAPSLGASCGATFATQGSAASAIWACMAMKCKSTCL